ncbi:zinc finger protein 346 [Gouania willdenowi]|nr:zinc finger protein 346-like [Gouania willdenowi]
MQSEDNYFPTAPAEINKMIKEHGDMFTDSQCKVCSAVLNSESQKLTHYLSKKHANKLRRYLSMQSDQEPELKKAKPFATDSDCNNGATDPTKACHLCNMTFTSPVMAETHYQGKCHAKNLRLKLAANETRVMQRAATVQPKKNSAEDSCSPAVPSGNNNNNDPDRLCSICQASFNNPLMAQQHYVGKKHRKQMTKLKLMETYGPSKASASTTSGYPCTVCNIELNSVAQYQSHISGAKHKNQVKKTGLNVTTETQQHSAEQFVASEDHLMADYQYTPTDDQQGGANDTENQAESYHCDPEDALLSEEFQFT